MGGKDWLSNEQAALLVQRTVSNPRHERTLYIWMDSPNAVSMVNYVNHALYKYPDLSVIFICQCTDLLPALSWLATYCMMPVSSTVYLRQMDPAKLARPVTHK
jgi:hypothetical protein